jgi:hypothetical protein
MANIYFGDGNLRTTDTNWNSSTQFTVSGVSVSPAVGDVYSNNSINYTITSTSISAGAGTINAGGSGAPTASGTLTRVSGSGDATISFSAQTGINWFTNQYVPPSTSNPGMNATPLNRIPNSGTDSVILSDHNAIGLPNLISTGPYTTWPGNITNNGASIEAGTYSGTINLAAFNNLCLIGQVCSIAYGNSTYVALTNLGNTYTSSDGTTWTYHYNNFYGNVAVYSARIVFGAGLFVMCVSNSYTTSPGIYYSSDGITWTRVAITATFSDICFANSLFTAVCSAGATCYTSTNGTSWTTRAGSPNLLQVVGNSSIFVAISGSVLYSSTNGFTWTSRTAITAAAASLAYANGLFCYLVSTSSKTSPDGITWTTTAFTGFTNYANGITFSSMSGGGASKFVTVGDDFNIISTIYSSSDGATWTSVGTSYRFSKASYCNGFYFTHDITTPTNYNFNPIGKSSNATTWFINIPDMPLICSIHGGTYTGSVTMNNYSYINGGTFNCPVYINNESAAIITGTFNQTVSLGLGYICGGTFKAIFTIQNIPFFNGTLKYITVIIGGTYTPPQTLTLTWSGNTPTVTGFVNDVGFAAAGGTFAPITTYVGFTRGSNTLNLSNTPIVV